MTPIEAAAAGIAERYAPQGAVWVCGACGKTARDKFGNERGWDESCMMNAVLCSDASIVRSGGRVVKAKAMRHAEIGEVDP